MKFLVAFVAIVAVASAAYVKPVVSANEELAAIIAAINHPSTDPATALLLEQQLFQILGLLPEPEPIAVGPVIVDEPTPIQVGPEIIDFPLPDGGAVTAEEPATIVDVMPVLDGQTPAPAPVVSGPAASPLVQIILNINSNNPGAVAINPEPVIVPEMPQVPQPSPVQVVEVAEDNNPIIPEPVIVVDTPPEPVIVVEPTFPVIPEPVIIPEPILVGQPSIIPDPAVVLPESLN